VNFVDVFILLLLVSTVIRGAQIGSVRQIFSTAGFIIGLLLGAWLQSALIGLAHTQLSRTIITLITTLGLAIMLMGAGEYLGVVLKSRLLRLKLNVVDSVLGSIVGIITLLVAVWLAAAVLITLPFPGLQDDVRGSFIVSTLNHDLPSAPNVVADLGHLIDPNGFPQVFTGQEPEPKSTKLPNIGDLQPAVTKDAASVLKIEGRGCGGIVEGSGFVVAHNLVATNAHVVAGVAHPIVFDHGAQHTAQAIWFDPNFDFAVLRVDHLNETPLALSAGIAANNTPSVVMGFPGGGDFSAQAAAIIDEFTATGRNIYNQGVTNRDIYEIKATVIPGNSGGPIVQADGSVIGVVFAESTTYNDVGYALTMPKVVSEIHQSQTQNQPVSTGSCAQ